MKKVFALSLASLLALQAVAAPTTFKIVGEKLSYRNLATVESQSDFETFTGKTNNVSGAITYDPKTKTGGGTVVIDVASIDTGIPTRNEHMKSEGWMNAAKFPTIEFTATKVSAGKDGKYKVVGKLTLHGVTKVVTGTAKINYRDEGDATKKAGFSGSVIQLSASVAVKLSDFGIAIPDFVKGKVANDVTLGVSAYAVDK